MPVRSRCATNAAALHTRLPGRCKAVHDNAPSPQATTNPSRDASRIVPGVPLPSTDEARLRSRYVAQLEKAEDAVQALLAEIESAHAEQARLTADVRARIRALDTGTRD